MKSHFHSLLFFYGKKLGQQLPNVLWSCSPFFHNGLFPPALSSSSSPGRHLRLHEISHEIQNGNTQESQEDGYSHLGSYEISCDPGRPGKGHWSHPAELLWVWGCFTWFNSKIKTCYTLNSRNFSFLNRGDKNAYFYLLFLEATFKIEFMMLFRSQFQKQSHQNLFLL